eukprot:Plantae.Rhodophyta-Purpureofilum_apyrenoidigerum.ctg44172.p1 GENE.Plantae.Rhodophyta-Purpureofilum_apyrenoidigerum.ctg44172~~Plantae.Rhodophyta-Purpureofilum_apyrenoidigerum.ctg44172.p1  ORF type:complete len:151 (+),score=23.36 Plantae.Rhodophyta-Purpureofilum_apyrenoidigerum.ctg44172:185-637(+)
MDVGKLLNAESDAVRKESLGECNPTRDGSTGSKSDSNLEKEFFCETCLSVFATKANLKVHTQTVHMRLTPYTCDMCSKQFGTSSSMRRHQKIVHQSDRPFRCIMCEKTFATRSCIRRHYVKVHRQSRDFAEGLVAQSSTGIIRGRTYSSL